MTKHSAHVRFGAQSLTEGLSADLVRKIMIDNPFATYGRLQQVARDTPAIQ